MTTETAPPRPAILDLDAEEIGNALIRLGPMSHALWHEHVTDSLRPYCGHPGQLSPEAQFVYDMFCRRTPEIIDRWYGGEAGFMDMHPAYAMAGEFEPEADD